MEKLLQVCITMPARDYAAFEDLATDIGIDPDAIDIQVPEPAEAPPLKRRGRGVAKRKPVYLSTEVWDRIRSMNADVGWTEMRRRLITECGEKNVPSPETIKRVVVGKVDRPNRSLIK